MNKAYERINWENYPSENTALNESNLNKMDAALNEVDNRVVAHETTKLDKATANSMVKDVDFNETTGIFTITFLNGVTKTLDTKLEKIATNFRYDYATQKLILTLVDGTTQEIDMSTLITQYEFADSSYIKWTIMSDGKIKAEIINGSITADKLQPNFLADVTLQANNAKTSEQNAKTSEENAKQSEINAKNYADSAEPVASTAQGLNPTLENSTHAPFISFKGDGATEQQTYTGKNKLNTSGLTEVTKNGITFTPVYENGMLQYVNVNGTATDVTIYNFPISLENGNYILNGCDDGNSSTYVLTARLVINGVNHWINNFSDEKSFTVDDTVTEMSSYIQVYSGATVNNKKFYPMIRLATETDATYEPYVGGMASPNPSYPQEIHGVGESGSLAVKTTGKNLFDEVNYNKYIYSKTVGADLTTIATNRYGVTDFIDGSKDIFISCIENKDITCILWGIKDDKIALFKSGAEMSYKGGAYDYLVVGFGTISGVNLTTDALINAECMVEFNTWKTDYEPHTETTANIPIDAPLYEGDYIRYNMDGTGELVRKMASVVLDGTTKRMTVGSDYADTRLNYAYRLIEDRKAGTPIQSNIGTGNLESFTEGIYGHATNKAVLLCLSDKRTGVVSTDTSAEIVSKFNAWLAENPITVVYELAEPTVTPLTAEQIAEFEKLRTFDGTTHIMCEADSEAQYFYNSVSGKAVAMIANMLKK